MPAGYTVRDGGDAKSKKQSMADLKLRRLQELNSRLKEDLERPRIKVSEASMRYGCEAHSKTCDFAGLQAAVLTPFAVLSAIAITPATTWFHQSGDKSTRGRIHTTRKALKEEATDVVR